MNHHRYAIRLKMLVAFIFFTSIFPKPFNYSSWYSHSSICSNASNRTSPPVSNAAFFFESSMYKLLIHFPPFKHVRPLLPLLMNPNRKMPHLANVIFLAIERNAKIVTSILKVREAICRYDPIFSRHPEAMRLPGIHLTNVHCIMTENR